MKRIGYLVLLALICAGAVSAQQWGPGCGSWGKGSGYGHRRRAGPGPGYYREHSRTNWEALTLKGNLELVDGNIALRQDAVTYYITGLTRLIGFIDGLTEGAEITVEGAARTLPDRGDEEGERRIFLVSTLGINGRTYENLTPAVTARQGNAPPRYPRPQWNTKHRRDGFRHFERGF
ncbi:MAG: hypothetical protein LBH57_01120 [Treponema sp.]|nr:hypothetical protein [Treponema sp.]